MLRIWPQKPKIAAHHPVTRRARGRPKRKAHDLILQEAKRRIDADENLPKTLKEFANELRTWFVAAHPKLKPLVELYIENLVRDLWEERPQK